MPLATKSAQQAARCFVQQYRDMPSICYPMPRKYRPEKQCRYFDIRYTDPNTNEDFLLMELNVFDDGRVSIHKDRREEVRRALSAKGLGLPDASFKPQSAMQRFRNALAGSFNKPDWFERIELPELGPWHAIAHIRDKSGEQVHVPVRIWESKADKAAYFSAPDAEDFTRKVGIVIPIAITPAEIRTKLFSYLENKR